MKTVIITLITIVISYVSCTDSINSDNCDLSHVKCAQDYSYQIELIENLDSNLLGCMTEYYGLFKIFRNEADYRSLIVCPDKDTTIITGDKLPTIDFCTYTLLSGAVYAPQTNFKIQSSEFISICPYFILKVKIKETEGPGLTVEYRLPYLYILPVLPDSLEYFLTEEIQFEDGTVTLQDTILIKEFY